LLLASENGSEEIVTQLLAAKADVNIAGEQGITPLIASVQIGNAKIVKLLLAAKPAPNVNITAGQSKATALLLAAQSGYGEVVTLLITAKAKIDARTASGATALILAIASSHENIAKALITAGADVNAKTGNFTPLSLAKRNNMGKLVKLLEDAGAKAPAKKN